MGDEARTKERKGKIRHDFGAQRIDRHKTKASRQKQKKLHSVIDFYWKYGYAAILPYYFYPKKRDDRKKWSCVSFVSCVQPFGVWSNVTSFSLCTACWWKCYWFLFFSRLKLSPTLCSDRYFFVWDCNRRKLVILTTKMVADGKFGMNSNIGQPQWSHLK